MFIYFYISFLSFSPAEDRPALKFKMLDNKLYYLKVLSLYPRLCRVYIISSLIMYLINHHISNLLKETNIDKTLLNIKVTINYINKNRRCFNYNINEKIIINVKII